MIQTLVTNHSNRIANQIKKFELDYPMGSYIPYWKIFRAFSKENELIATAIKSTHIWKTSANSSIIDIGTGDGLVLRNLSKEKDKSTSYTVIEPNKELIEEAERNLKNIDLLKTVNKDLFSTNLKQLLTGNEVILLVHVLYLLNTNSLKKLVNNIPSGSKLIIVTDGLSSLFSDCWSLTAPKFADRSKNIHTEIEGLEKINKIQISKSTFKTLLKNPFKIGREDLRNALLSMITYSVFNTLPTDCKIEVKEIFDKYATQDLVQCDSICYELITS